MFGCRNHSEIFRVFSLHSGDESDSHPSSKIWIFAIGFLTTSPAWIPEYVNVRRPEIQAFHNVAAPGKDGLVVFRPGLCAYHNCHFVDQRSIKGGSESNRLRKNSGSSGISNSVQGFAPPVVRGHLQPRDGSSLAHQL